jgi:hypothetical protein
MGLEYPKEHQLLYDKKGELFSTTKEPVQRASSEYPYFKDSIVRVISLTHYWYIVIQRQNMEFLNKYIP